MTSKKHSPKVAFGTDPDSTLEEAAPAESDEALGDAATGADTRANFTRRSARGYSVYRHVLVQLPDPKKPRASTLGKMVSARQRRELLLYMLLLTAWPWLKDRSLPFSSDVWTRALSIDDDETDPRVRKNALTWSPSTLSRSWKALEKLNLIEKRGPREDRWVRIVPRREDSEKEYSAPGGRRDRFNTYFTLPDRFWLENDFARLTLPGLAMLLVIAKETSYRAEVWFTQTNIADWYGVSRTTVQAGLKELDDLGLLRTRMEIIKAPLAPKGITKRMHYSLGGDYGYRARTAARANAKKAGDVRRKAQLTEPDAA